MGHTFLTPDVIAGASIGILQREIVLPQLIWRDAEAEFNGKIGDTVTVRIPATAVAREFDRNVGITTDDLTEVPLSVVLNKHPYHAAAVTDEQLTLEIGDFGRQVLQPQVMAVALTLEGYIATCMGTATYDAAELNPDTSPSGDDPFEVLIDAASALNLRDVPRSQRRLVVGANVEAWILKSDKFSRVDASGTDTALRDALIRRGAGFDIYASNAIDPDEAYAFHRTAFIFANRAPVVPDGATMGTGIATNGLSVRWIRDYDAKYLQDRSIISSFAGVVSSEDDGAKNYRAVKIVIPS